MYFDLQIHSKNSLCSIPEMTLGNILASAEKRQLDGVGITDHIHPTTDLEIVSDNLAVRSSLPVSRCKVWIGVETDVLDNDGTITGDQELWTMSDYVLAGVHHFHLPWVQSPDSSWTTLRIIDFAHQQLIGATENHYVHCLAHPWVGLFKYLRGFEFDYSMLPRTLVTELGHCALENNTAVEIPAWAMFRLGNEPDPDYLRYFVRPLIETGCHISTGTDAHSVNAVGKGIPELVTMLRSEGLQLFWTPTKLAIGI